MAIINHFNGTGAALRLASSLRYASAVASTSATPISSIAKRNLTGEELRKHALAEIARQDQEIAKEREVSAQAFRQAFNSDLTNNLPEPLTAPFLELRHVKVPCQKLFPPASRLSPAIAEPLEISGEIFDVEYRSDILHTCVALAHLSTKQPVAHAKNKSEHRGSGRKLRPQKGTGRARLGDSSSPMLHGGPSTKGPRNTRIWKRHIMRKVWDHGMRIAFSQKRREGKLLAFESLWIPPTDPERLLQSLRDSGLTDKTILVIGNSHPVEFGRNSIHNQFGVETQSTNLQTSLIGSKVTTVKRVQELEITDIIKARLIVCDQESIEYITAKLNPANAPVQLAGKLPAPHSLESANERFKLQQEMMLKKKEALIARSFGHSVTSPKLRGRYEHMRKKLIDNQQM